MEEEELLSPEEIRKIENELELKLANMTLEDLEMSSGSVSDEIVNFNLNAQQRHCKIGAT